MFRIQRVNLVKISYNTTSHKYLTLWIYTYKYVSMIPKTVIHRIKLEFTLAMLMKMQVQNVGDNYYQNKVD